MYILFVIGEGRRNLYDDTAVNGELYIVFTRFSFDLRATLEYMGHRDQGKVVGRPDRVYFPPTSKCKHRNMRDSFKSDILFWQSQQNTQDLTNTMLQWFRNIAACLCVERSIQN